MKGPPQLTRAELDRPELDRPPWASVVIALVVACALLYATLGRYGYHRDELYFRMLPLRWGYVDQPFLTPLLAKVSANVFGDTVYGLRMLAPLFLGAGVVIAALMTRELGGTSRAQGLAAWAYAFAGLPLLSGHLMVTGTLDLTLWSAALLAMTRALLHDPRWWVACGAVLGLAADNKLLVALLVVSVAAGLLLCGPRSVPRAMWLGVLAALVVAAPTIGYQLTHHLPQMTMVGALHAKADGVQVQVITYQALLVGPPLVAVAVAGLNGLLRRPQWRPARALGVAYLVALAINVAAGGQVYYAFGLLAYLLAAGWVVAEQWADERTRRTLLVAAIALNAVVSSMIALPLLPVSHSSVQAALNGTVGDQIGWPTYVESVRSVWASLPAAERARAVVLTGNYGEAGALDRFAPSLPVYSAQNELYFLRVPPADRDVVVVWTEDYDQTAATFQNCRRAATLNNGVGVDNEEQGSIVAVCRLPAEGWKALWPRLQHYD